MFHAFRSALNSTASSLVHTGDEFNRFVISADCFELALEKANSVATSPMLRPNAAFGAIPRMSFAKVVNIVE